jgi:hypothetical protein
VNANVLGTQICRDINLQDHLDSTFLHLEFNYLFLCILLQSINMSLYKTCITIKLTAHIPKKYPDNNTLFLLFFMRSLKTKLINNSRVLLYEKPRNSLTKGQWFLIFI